MQVPLYRDLGFGLTRIDTGLGRPGLAACYLLAHEGRLAVIETGTGQTVPRVLDLIRERGHRPEDVDYVIITHVHLDHAGGVGGLMQALPAAKLVVHPRGARHMEDPAQLQAGAIAVYGEASFKQQYGELTPVPGERMIRPEDGDSLQLAGRTLRFYDTPGHARHHFCVWDEFSRGIFSGDTLGVSYRELSDAPQPFVFPTTTPVQFEPERLKASADRLWALGPERFYLTHFGMVQATASHIEQLKTQIDGYVRIAERHRDSEQRPQKIAADLLDYTLQRLADHGSPLEQEEQQALLAGDLMLNAQGLEVWLQKQEKQAD